MTLYVRMAGPGQFRGEGQWKEFNGDQDDWDYLLSTGYLPIGWTATTGEAGAINKDGFSVPMGTNREYSEGQLESLIEQIGQADVEG